MSESNQKMQEKIEAHQKKCFKTLIKSDFLQKSNTKFCGAIFDDKHFCWPPTEVNKIINQSCRTDLLMSNKNEINIIATKECRENGTWGPTNITDCGTLFLGMVDDDFLKNWLSIIVHTACTGYVISILAAFLAILIIISIKRLHCARNHLHIHLFISFIMRGCMYLLKTILFVNGTALPEDTEFENGDPTFSKKSSEYSWKCKTIISLFNYFLLANFIFILMEGFYLHNLIFLNLFSKTNSVKVYWIIGWVCPLIFTIPWIILKCYYENVYCWTENDKIWITLWIDLPIAMTVAINFLLFLSIIRVMFRKINSAYIQQRRLKYSKLLKSTLFLILFYGVPYAVSEIVKICERMSLITDQTVVMFWLLGDQIFSALQGLIAALVYCLLNNDVQTELKRKYRSLRERNNRKFRRCRTISHTQQFSLHNLEGPD